MPDDKAKDLNWSNGLPGKRLQEALLNWQVEELSDEFYRMVNLDSDDLKIIFGRLQSLHPS